MVDTLRRAKPGVFGNILKQINAKCRLDLYRIVMPFKGTSMIIGMDVVNEGKRSIIGLSASYNQYNS